MTPDRNAVLTNGKRRVCVCPLPFLRRGGPRCLSAAISVPLDQSGGVGHQYLLRRRHQLRDGRAVSGPATDRRLQLEDALRYIWLVQALIMVVVPFGWTDLMLTIRSGDVVSDLTKPCDFYWYWFSREVGRDGFLLPVPDRTHLPRRHVALRFGRRPVAGRICCGPDLLVDWRRARNSISVSLQHRRILDH